ncbi:hypothetical protein [Massilia sp. Se16.2.3]|uniref:hypothetical protein n=1 Tax=Massilia sp. Se16.2.3 TaxID=2709303 RepID=UPI00160054A0|nr:hypothetical protein [Massilia sp. Se16.2.3]QNA99270.1 hypothetical protein G4G31_11105 [Massilia sp. Se16.2.3]
MTPTLGQAVWTTGFSQSFANGSLFDIHTHAFGIPRPAAIAFGLAGAWPAGLLIRLGLHPADAYAGMVAAWLGLAMFSAYRVARLFGAGRPLALPGAVAWMSMPIVWAHAGYSMLSLGIALLPFYFMAAIRLFMLAPGSRRIGAADAALYCAAAVLSVFMDGYTFMMFACGASMFLLYAFLVRPEARRTLACFAVPVHVASFGLAYLLFSAYIGKSHFEAQQLDFFRAWGLDLSFAAIPTRGLLWLPDLLGWSVERSDARYFGDDSVWRTTFALPLLLVALAAWWRGRQKGFATAAVLVAAFGFYMALGPALKINATKPVAGHAAPSGRALTAPPPIGLVPTGNALDLRDAARLQCHARFLPLVGPRHLRAMAPRHGPDRRQGRAGHAPVAGRAAPDHPVQPARPARAVAPGRGQPDHVQADRPGSRGQPASAHPAGRNGHVPPME